MQAPCKLAEESVSGTESFNASQFVSYMQRNYSEFMYFYAVFCRRDPAAWQERAHCQTATGPRPVADLYHPFINELFRWKSIRSPVMQTKYMPRFPRFPVLQHYQKIQARFALFLLLYLFPLQVFESYRLIIIPMWSPTLLTWLLLSRPPTMFISLSLLKFYHLPWPKFYPFKVGLAPWVILLTSKRENTFSFLNSEKSPS